MYVIHIRTRSGATASFTRVSTDLLASVWRVSPSAPFAGSFAGSCHPVFHNLLMPKHPSWSQLSESNRRPTVYKTVGSFGPIRQPDYGIGTLRASRSFL